MHNEFTITHRKEIEFHLRALLKQGEHFSISEPAGTSFLTVLVGVDVENNLISFDAPPNDLTVRHLTQAPRIRVAANPQGVRHEFEMESVFIGREQGSVVLQGRFPSRYMRLQRREHYRFHIPYAKRPVARLNHQGMVIDFSIVDMGLGGVCLETSRLDWPVETDKTYPVVLMINGFGEFHVNIDIRHSEHVEHPGGNVITRWRCAFVDLKSTTENWLHKFLTSIQTEEKKVARG